MKDGDGCNGGWWMVQSDCRQVWMVASQTTVHGTCEGGVYRKGHCLIVGRRERLILLVVCYIVLCGIKK